MKFLNILDIFENIEFFEISTTHNDKENSPKRKQVKWWKIQSIITTKTVIQAKRLPPLKIDSITTKRRGKRASSQKECTPGETGQYNDPGIVL